jgi:hypothetical protein
VKKKIFIGFSEVANYYTNLTKGFKEIGYEYYLITFGKNKRLYNIEDEKFFDQKITHFLTNKINKSIFYKIFYYPFFIILRVYLFIKYFFKCNIFIFSYNSSFLWLYDLPILKFFNKKIIFVYHGSDSRPPYLSGNYIDNGFSLNFVKKFTHWIYKKNKIVEKYADHIVSLPSSGQFFSRELINFLWIGLPFELKDYQLKQSSKDDELVKIIHAPSARKAKGTEEFRKIIAELNKEGYNIYFKELHDVKNQEVLDQLQTSDILLDELYSDTVMAGFATEGAYFSVPTVVGGYYKNIKKDMKNMDLPPSVYVEPSEIKKALIELIISRNKREALGKNAMEYVHNKWSPKLVAERFSMLIENKKLSEVAYFHQNDIDYFNGWGVNKKDLKNFLQEYIGKFGKEGLFLSHNKKLEKKILDYINDNI